MVRINRSAETAITAHNKEVLQPNTIALYTDGSGIESCVGTAAVAPAWKVESTAYMGKSTTSTVYAAELCGIQLALGICSEHFARHKDHKYKQICIYTDNQAAIQRVSNPRASTAAYIVHEIIKLVDQLRSKSGVDVKIAWIPAHVGVEGNEEADKAAKLAAGWSPNGFVPGIQAAPPKRLYTLTTGVKCQVKAMLLSRWTHQWQDSKKGGHSRNLTLVPTNKTLQIHTNVPRPISSLIVQLRTGKIGLPDFLFRKRVPSQTTRRCRCNLSAGTVEHTLLTCRIYRQERQELLPRRNGPYTLRKILTEQKSAVAAAHYMLKTQLLGQFKGVVIDNIEERDPFGQGVT